MTLHGGSGVRSRSSQPLQTSMEQEPEPLQRPSMSAVLRVVPPEPFSFSQPEADGSAASRGSGKRQGWSYKESKHKSTCSYTAWVMKQRTFCSLSLSHRTEEAVRHCQGAVQCAFHPKTECHFRERRFNSRKQEQGEPMDVFITALYTLSEHCNYSSLREEMICDSIVVGIRNAQLTEKLQLDSHLTLATAVAQVRQSETVKLQQPILRGTTSDIPIDAVQTSKSGLKKPCQPCDSRRTGRATANNKPENTTACIWCGRLMPTHDRQHCPARKVTCHKCKKQGHF